MELLERIAARLDAINSAVGRSAAWLSIPIVAIVVLDVVTRRFLTLGSVTLQELEWHLHAVLFLFCAAYAYIDDTHVRVDILRARLGEVPRAWIELIGAIFFLTPYSIVMVILGSQFVIDSYLLNEVSDAPGGLPFRFVIKSALPIGFLLLTLQGISTVAKQILILKGRKSIGGADVR
jgi:TRAP-type mannitol/chloroaromatic compound transport system permease small subunit